MTSDMEEYKIFGKHVVFDRKGEYETHAPLISHILSHLENRDARHLFHTRYLNYSVLDRFNKVCFERLGIRIIFQITYLNFIPQVLKTFIFDMNSPDHQFNIFPSIDIDGAIARSNAYYDINLRNFESSNDARIKRINICLIAKD